MKRFLYLCTWVLIGLTSLTGCGETEPTADMVLYNGSIYIVDDAFTVAEAIAISGNRILDYGTNEELKSHITSAQRTVDLEGRVVLPGLIDAHAHLFGYAANLDQLNAVGTTSKQQIADMVAAKIAEAGEDAWVLGRGWDQNDWEVATFPLAADLDAVSPDTPVALRRIDGHAMWVNSAVLEIAGITAATEDPEGGEIIRDAEGEPTGVLIDRAMGLVSPHIPQPSPERMGVLLQQALEDLLSVGLTGMHDMGGGPGEIALVKDAIEKDAFPFRVYFHYASTLPNLDALLAEGTQSHGDLQLIVAAVKAYADGALGSRGAAMLEPYSDRPESSGLLISTEEHMVALTKRCLEAGFQVSTHAIGDRANRTVLNAYETALAEMGAEDARLRIEHAQIISLEDIPRFNQLNVLPSMQQTHCTSDQPWATARVGEERMEGAYAWRKLLDTGVIIPGGSDFPVEEINPFYGLYAAITRQHQDGTPPGGYQPEERMSREEALRSFTIWAAYAGFMEDEVGSLEKGKRADLIVIDRDIMEVPEIEIPETKVLMTMVNGSFVSADMQK